MMNEFEHGHENGHEHHAAAPPPPAQHQESGRDWFDVQRDRELSMIAQTARKMTTGQRAALEEEARHKWKRQRELYVEKTARALAEREAMQAKAKAALEAAAQVARENAARKTTQKIAPRPRLVIGADEGSGPPPPDRDGGPREIDRDGGPREIDRDGGPPEIDCRAPWSPQGVIISDTTAILFVEIFMQARGHGLLAAASRRGAENLQRAFDEVELIVRDVAAPTADRPEVEG